MAAYASLVSLAQTIQHFLLYHHHQFPSTCLVGKLDIESLQEHVNLLQAFLDDCPDKATADLEGRIRDASNVAEDVIERLMLEPFQSAGSQDFPFVRHLKGLWKKLKVRYNLQILSNKLQEIGSIGAEVMDIKNMTTTMKLNVSSSAAAAAAGGVSSSGLPPGTEKDDIMVGFDDDLLAIKTRLCGGSSRLEIIPICGMGGIGKTTLAKKAYKDPLTVEYFHIRAWVTVSQDYKAQEVLSRLQNAMKAFVKGQSGQSDEAVHKSLKGRRYLIVLDDMWSSEVWDDVKRILPDDNEGSRIMLTTRLADLATYANSSGHLHQMHLMDVSWSWQLLQQKVFKKEHCPPQLEKIGRRIAGSCKGLPLAIVVVAGILSTINPTEASWQNVASEVISTFTANNDEITKIFSLSYTHLPHHLRPCFLYMGGLPEDHDIRVSKLVKLWTAEGFLKPAGGSKSFEEVGEVYLEDLVKRSLVFVTRREPNGKIKSCSIHDLLRDLCIRKAMEEKFLLCISRTSQRNLNQHRRVSVGELDIPYINLLRLCGPTVHSILFYGWQQLSGLRKLKLLRVLDATKTEFDEFPDDVLNLCLLRYLAFRIPGNSKIIDVPPSISELRNLQTLLIFVNEKYYPRGEIRLWFPLEIWSMRRLRNLHVVGRNVAVHLPEPCSTAFPLQDLQTLATVINFRCTEGVLQMIPNLKKLGIIYDVDDIRRIKWEKYHLDNLVHLGHLEELSIRVKLSVHMHNITFRRVPTWGGPRFPMWGEPRFPMWGEPQFPMMLKNLKLEGLELSQQIMKIIGSMPNLEVLKLIRCPFEDGTWETTEEEFSKLKVLIMFVTNLKKWTTESSCFPSLNHLNLFECNYLREIPGEIGEIPTLELIEVDDWNKYLVESAEWIKREQQCYGNDSVQVRILKQW